MEFSLTDEQTQFKDGLSRYLSTEYRFEARRQALLAAAPFSPRANSHWKTFAEFGLLGLGIPESCGGLGTASNMGGSGSFAEDTMITMECFGRALVVEPYLSSVVLCGSLLRGFAESERCTALLTAIAAGESTAALAIHERAGRYQWQHVGTTARVEADGYRVDGTKSNVLHGDCADYLLVSARTSGATSDRLGISLFILARNAPGVSVRGYDTHDGQRAAEITLQNVALPQDALIGTIGDAHGAIEHAVGFGIAAMCADALGAMAALVEQTLEYLKTRKQFGVPIGTFQALQHRMVDMFIAVEQARSITMLAAVKVNSNDAHERDRVLAAAKSLVGQMARRVGQEAVQLHGGMGVTDELPVSHYFKRLTAFDLNFGDAHYHRARLGELLAA